MIPLRDSTHSRTIPYVTIGLIILNLYIFFQQSISSPLEAEYQLLHYAFIPSLLTERIEAFSVLGFFHLPLVTSIFLHGGWFHVIFNMLYLWIFGDNVEDKLGHLRFLFFYLFLGIGANLIYYLTATNSSIPLVGASGAIAGILGAYIVTYPKAKITTLIFIFVFILIRKIPAFYFLLFWFGIQILNALTNMGITDSSVAWWAHVGGFLLGALFMPLLAEKRETLI